jgi:hypothetical protein
MREANLEPDYMFDWHVRAPNGKVNKSYGKKESEDQDNFEIDEYKNEAVDNDISLNKVPVFETKFIKNRQY